MPRGGKNTSVRPKSRCVQLRLKIGMRPTLLASPVPTAAMACSDAACKRRPVPGESQGAFTATTEILIVRNSVACVIDEARTSPLCPELGEQPSPSDAGG